MFLRNVRLTRFKCHTDLFMDFSVSSEGKQSVRKTTFLMGENGTGKSALLEAIALVTGGSEALWQVPGLPDAFIQQGADDATISATITTAQGEERSLELRLQRGATIAATVAAARTGLAPMDAALRHTHRSYFAAGYGSGRRMARPGLATGLRASSNARYAAVQSLFSKDLILRPVDEWAATGSLCQNRDEASDALRQALNTFLPAEVCFHQLAPDGRLLFHTPDGELPLEALSNGYQQTVAWVSNLLYHVTRTFGDYKNPLAARGLLLIDEIDLHLHPAWQRQLYRFLAQGLPHFQVIATTYSPLTAQQAAPHELYNLQRQPTGSIALTSFEGDPAWTLMHQLLMSPVDEEELTAATEVIPIMPGKPRHKRATPLRAEGEESSAAA